MKRGWADSDESDDEGPALIDESDDESDARPCSPPPQSDDESDARSRSPPPRPFRRSGSFSDNVACSGAIPHLLLVLVAYISSRYAACGRLGCLELFAGCHSIVNGFKDLGMPAVGMDYATGSAFDDVNTTPGFVRALLFVLGLEPDGMLWAAPPCRTWVWIGRWQTQRSARNPLGSNSGCVAEANVQVACVVLLILIGLLLHNVRFWFEQPASSLIEGHPRVQQLQAILNSSMERVFTWLQEYGAEACKPLHLWTNAEHADTMYRKLVARPHVKTATVRMANGRAQVTGIANTLTATAAYPKQFGLAVAHHHAMHRVCFGEGVPVDNLDGIQSSGDLWEDAQLPRVCADLGLS